MSLSHEHVRPKILGKIKTYVLTRAELLFNLCYEIPCRWFCLEIFKSRKTKKFRRSQFRENGLLLLVRLQIYIWLPIFFSCLASPWKSNLCITSKIPTYIPHRKLDTGHVWILTNWVACKYFQSSAFLATNWAMRVVFKGATAGWQMIAKSE